MNLTVFIGNFLEPVSYGLSFLFLVLLTFQQSHLKWKVLALYYFLAAILMFKAAMVDNNIRLYSILSLLTSTALSIYFYYTLDARRKKITVLVIYAANVLYFLTTEVITKSTVFDSGAFVLLSFSVVIMVFMFMHQILSNVTEQPLSHNFDFWFSCAQLVYNVGAFAIFLSNRYLSHIVMQENSIESRILFTELWGVHCVLLFLSALIIGASVLWIYSRNKSRSY